MKANFSMALVHSAGTRMGFFGSFGLGRARCNSVPPFLSTKWGALLVYVRCVVSPLFIGLSCGYLQFYRRRKRLCDSYRCQGMDICTATRTEAYLCTSTTIGAPSYTKKRDKPCLNRLSFAFPLSLIRRDDSCAFLLTFFPEFSLISSYTLFLSN